MATIKIEANTLRDLIDQAKVAPPRDQNAQYAILDAERALADRLHSQQIPGQLSLFDTEEDESGTP